MAEKTYPIWLSPEERHGWDLVPEHVQGGIDQYVSVGLEPGDFLKAVIENDFSQAMVRADNINVYGMVHIARFMLNGMPSPAWGDRQRRLRWQAAGGLAREARRWV